MKYQLIYPIVVYALYIWAVNVYLLRIRFGAVKSKKLSRHFYKALNTGETQPEDVHIAGRHLDNQYQVPTLFFAACATHIALGHADQLTVALAWGFVVSRWMHSYIHLGSNHIYKRIAAFAAGWFMVNCLFLQLAYFAAVN